MSTYDVEHNTPDPSTTQLPHRRRPDLGGFFSLLNELTPEPNTTRSRPDAVPAQGDMMAVFLSLADWFNEVRRERGGNTGTNDENNNVDDDLLRHMINSLLSGSRNPPREVEGVSEEFCNVLDRVPRNKLQPSQICPICNSPFLEDPYPLVVQLPCHPTHKFDLECIQPWLRLRGTCPLDRRDFAKEEREKAEARKQKPADDDEEEWDGMYG